MPSDMFRELLDRSEAAREPKSPRATEPAAKAAEGLAARSSRDATSATRTVSFVIVGVV